MSERQLDSYSQRSAQNDHLLGQLTGEDRRNAYQAQDTRRLDRAQEHLPALTLVDEAVRAHRDVFDPNHDGRITLQEAQRAASLPNLDRNTSTAAVVLNRQHSQIAQLHDDRNPLAAAAADALGMRTVDNAVSMNDLARLRTADPLSSVAQRAEVTVRQMERMPADRSLFGARNEVTPAAVQQGSVGDCSFMATLASMASTPQGQQMIRNMIRPQGDNFRVTFPSGESVVVAPPTTAEMALFAHNSGLGTWPALLERAYGQLLAQRRHQSVTNPQRAADNCEPENPFATLTGRHVQERQSGTDTMTENDLHNRLVHMSQDSLAMTAGTGRNPSIMRARLHAENPDAPINTLSPTARVEGGTGRRAIFTQHVYSIDHYDQRSRTVYLRNPHNARELLSMPLNDFRQAFVGINAAHNQTR